MTQGDDLFDAEKAESTASGRTLEDIANRLQEMQLALAARTSLIPPADAESPDAPRP
jgi:hypothetical protein